MTQGERIRKIRKSKKLTMDQFGDNIGVTKSTISNIENGNRNATEHMIKSICREYRVDYLWLTQGIGDMYIQEDAKIKLYRMIDQVLEGENEHVKRVFKNFSELTEKDYEDLLRIMDQLLDEKEPE